MVSQQSEPTERDFKDFFFAGSQFSLLVPSNSSEGPASAASSSSMSGHSLPAELKTFALVKMF